MSAAVRWIERSRFFARPRQVGNLTCSGDEKQDFTFSSCRSSAAGSCNVPESATLPGDACICPQIHIYNTMFSACMHDTPYSACIDPNNNSIMEEWSSGHCSSKDPSTSTPNPPITSPSTPPPSSTPQPSSTPDPPNPPDSSVASTTDAPPQTSDGPTPAPSSNLAPTPQDSSKQSKSEKPSPTPESSPNMAPAPSLVPVSIAPHVSAQTTGPVATSTSVHVPVAKYPGSGALLQGYCATPEYTIIDGPTAYWAPVIGCVGDKPDCCPFDVPPPTIGSEIIATVPRTIVVVVSSGGATPTAVSGGFPLALSPAQATLDACPDDYHSVGGGCCPSHYFPWSTAFGGQTPCYSALPTAMTPPPIPENLQATGDAAGKPTSAIINVVYAMSYPVQPPKQGLATGAKIGIGVGGGVVAAVLGMLLWLLMWKHRAHKRDKAALESLSGFGPGLSSTRQSLAASNAASTNAGVTHWRDSVIPQPPAQGRFSEGLEPTLPNVAPYPADWRPGQRTVSPPIPARYSSTTPSIPEGYSEIDSQQGMISRHSNTPGVGSDGGYNSNRSELQGEEYPFPRHELQGVPEGQAWNGQQMSQVHVQGQHPWAGQFGGPGQGRYSEAPGAAM